MNIKTVLILLVFVTIACNKQKETETNNNDTLVSIDSIIVEETVELEKQNLKEFSNERFRKVTMEKVGENKFRLRGEAQVFEATFNWVIEDGHYVFDQGFQTTNAGAPEWGKFDFTVEAKKTDNNSTLHIVLYEASAKDGSHQYELPVTLE